MSLIAMQSPETATGEVARIYSEMQQMMGSVPNAMRIFSLNPSGCGSSGTISVTT